MRQTVVKNGKGDIIHFGRWPKRVMSGYGELDERSIALVPNPMPQGAYEVEIEVEITGPH